MAYSIQTAVSDGTLEVLDLSIKYMDKSHIFVYVDDVLVDGSAYSYVWLTDTRIQVVPAVANGSTVKVIRKTLTDEMWHEFSKGARFSTTSMDENFEQLLFLAQEYSEGIYVADFYTDVDIHLKRILNLGDPVNDGDAVNLKTLKEYLPNADLLPAIVDRVAAEEVKSLALLSQGITIGDKVITGFDGTSLSNNAWVHFAGRDTIGDGGGGYLRFLKGSTATANGVTVYAVTGGRLVREGWSIFGIDIRWAGAKLDGSDDAAAVRSAIQAAVSSSVGTKKVRIPYGQTGVCGIGSTIDITGAVTIEWDNNNVSLKKLFNGELFFVKSGLVEFVNPGIEGNAAAGFTGGGIRYGDAPTYFTFDCVVKNPRIKDTLDSGLIFNGPRGGSGISIVGGSITPYNPTGVSGASAAAIRLDGPADTDASVRKITDVDSSSSPLVDLTGMITTFIKGGQCSHILFDGNPNVSGASFYSAKAHITGVRVRDGLNIIGQDHVITGCISHGYAPGQTTWGFILKSQSGQGGIKLGVNYVAHGTVDQSAGLGGNTAEFTTYGQPYAVQWGGTVTNPVIGDGSITATYSVNGRMARVNIFVQMGSTTTFGSGSWYFTLPNNLLLEAGARGTGTCRMFNAGVKNEFGTVITRSTGNPSTVEILDNVSGNTVSPTVPHTWKSGDFLEFQFDWVRF